jgi:aldehyde dehydrogenase (NAD+)
MFHAGGGCKYGLSIAQQVYRFDDVQGLPLMESPTLSSNYIVRNPVGVCGALVSWNGGFMLAVRKVFTALAMGNSVILKPSPDGSLSSVELVRVFEKAGLPPGVLNLVTGGGEAGEALAMHPGVDMISFTGASQTGKRIMELGATNLKRLLLELGGKSPVIVCDDADLDVAVDGILFGGFMISGQACTAGSRVFVSPARHDELVERLVERAQTLVVGDTLDWDTDLGPLISSIQRDRVENYVQSGVQEGAKLVLGGSRLSSQSKGFYFEPTILTGVRNDMRIAREEIFGPVLSVIQVQDLDEAIRCANDTIYGLAASIWTTDYVNAVGISKRLRAGTVWVNDHGLNNALAPMGGFKQSGLGRENGGNLGFEEYTELKHLHIDLSARRDRKIYSIVVSH